MTSLDSLDHLAHAGAGWTAELARARLHFVTGKGGTGKTTLATALSLALASGGRRVLLVEVEGRQGIAQVTDNEPLPYGERHVLSARDGGDLRALHIDAEAALLEYFDMFYNLGFAGRTLRRMGAVEFATTLAPGLRDVLLTGKIKECVSRTESDGRYTYDHVVVDAPPTGRVVKFLDVTRALTDIAKTGPIRSQAEGVVKLMHSENTVVHIVTLLEEMPVRETLEAVAELDEADLRPGAVLINRMRPPRLPQDTLPEAARGNLDVDTIRRELSRIGYDLADEVLHGLVAEASEHAKRVTAEQSALDQLAEGDLPALQLPELTAGVDVAALYELADTLSEQGVR
ncbi:ArsA-related P-loop ATPase [Haloechinothrix sp. LS1_15]|uniref:ArsA-related P-loop ATPase n=1 Tax=Haloechinothrix sp. LS1_15 TaxID=2652248 RepID=UPI0029480EE6|nr:ArsA-related P-loop ATPase [Haloechinothrix sp. LS1_15]MDV6011333.1 AAA family ATPase [Haloechinothrix sp. LS1_15]